MNSKSNYNDKNNQSHKTVFVQIPCFSKIKITIRSDSTVALAIFHEPDRGIIRFSPGDSHPDGIRDFFITAEGVDRSGNLYVLKATTFDRFASKKKKNYFVLRKKDFQKI